MKIAMICALGVFSLSAARVFSQPAASHHRQGLNISEACLFFDSTVDKNATDQGNEEQVYAEAASRVHNLWCHPGAGTPEQKLNAADAMTVAWKSIWDRDDPYNALFHEEGASHLLALLELTHELTGTMRTDPKLVNLWAQECASSCFRIWADPEKPSGQQYIITLFRVVNDLRHNLKEEPASQPVWRMLEDAQFSLGD